MVCAKARDTASVFCFNKERVNQGVTIRIIKSCRVVNLLWEKRNVILRSRCKNFSYNNFLTGANRIQYSWVCLANKSVNLPREWNKFVNTLFSTLYIQIWLYYECFLFTITTFLSIFCTNCFYIYFPFYTARKSYKGLKPSGRRLLTLAIEERLKL